MLNLVSILTLTFVSEKKVLPILLLFSFVPPRAIYALFLNFSTKKSFENNLQLSLFEKGLEACWLLQT